MSTKNTIKIENEINDIIDNDLIYSIEIKYPYFGMPIHWIIWLNYSQNLVNEPKNDINIIKKIVVHELIPIYLFLPIFTYFTYF